MARRDKAEDNVVLGDKNAEEDFISDEEQVRAGGLETDYDLEDEYKPEPLVPGGNYRGNVVGVTYEAEAHAIAFKVTLADNGGVMSDGETNIDGWTGYKRVWVPKPGDRNEMTKDGRQTKRQSKINMQKRFADGMKINMNTPAITATAIAEQNWVGLAVIVSMTLSEYQGITRNEINRMVAAEATPIEE